MSGDGYPLGADCDLDALVAWRHRDYPQRFILGIDQAALAGIDWAEFSRGRVHVIPPEPCSVRVVDGRHDGYPLYEIGGIP